MPGEPRTQTLDVVVRGGESPNPTVVAALLVCPFYRRDNTALMDVNHRSAWMGDHHGNSSGGIVSTQCRA